MAFDFKNTYIVWFGYRCPVLGIEMSQNLPILLLLCFYSVILTLSLMTVFLKSLQVQNSTLKKKKNLRGRISECFFDPSISEIYFLPAYK